MLNTYENVTRFMDGIAVNLGADFMYLKDKKGTERIGASSISHENGRPIVMLDDIKSGKRLVFEGDHFKQYPSSHRQFSWFPSIQEAGVLHDGFDNDIQRAGMMQEGYKGLIFGELFSEVAQRQGLPFGDEAQIRLRDDVDFPALLYAHSLELMYAGVNENRDVLLLVHQPTGLSGSYVSGLNVERINLDGSLHGFLDANPELQGHLTDGRVSKDGGPYDTPKKIFEALRVAIPDEVLEAGYQRFKAERDARQRLTALREANPREVLEEQVKAIDPERVCRIGLSTADMDLDFLERESPANQ